MSEQLNQIQSMMEQLIRMVGSNNSSIEELRQDTKSSIEELRRDTKSSIEELRRDTKSSIEELRRDTKSSIEELRQDTKSSIEELHQEIKEIKENMATKADIATLDVKIEQYGQVQQQDVYHLIELINRKTDSIIATQTTQGESINILAMRQLQSEAEVAALKKAK